jgi:DNA replication protein DnaC
MLTLFTRDKDEAVKVAILGPGGMGKSSLALAVLHNPQVVQMFGNHRHFISCESADSAEGVALAISSHFKILGDTKPIQRVLKHLRSVDAPMLLILDNFETPWERQEARAPVENFLSQLTEVTRLNLIVRHSS